MCYWLCSWSLVSNKNIRNNMSFKLEPFVATYEDEIIATAKTLAELKKKLENVQVSNIYPTFKIFEIKINQIDRCFISRA